MWCVRLCVVHRQAYVCVCVWCGVVWCGVVCVWCVCVRACGHCDSEMYESYMCACSLPHAVPCVCWVASTSVYVCVYSIHTYIHSYIHTYIHTYMRNTVHTNVSLTLLYEFAVVPCRSFWFIVCPMMVKVEVQLMNSFVSPCFTEERSSWLCIIRRVPCKVFYLLYALNQLLLQQSPPEFS